MTVRRVSALVAVVVAGSALAGAHAATNGDDLRVPPRPVKWAKLSSHLASVLRAQLDSGRGLAVARSSGLRVTNGRVLVVVEARAARSSAAAAVVAVRGRVVATHADLVQALVAPGALGALSRSDAVAYVRTPASPITQGTAVVVG